MGLFYAVSSSPVIKHEIEAKGVLSSELWVKIRFRTLTTNPGTFNGGDSAS